MTPLASETSTGLSDQNARALALVERLAELRKFLSGEGELEGLSFGERPEPTTYRGTSRRWPRPFWWRSHLSRLDEAASLIRSLLEERDALQRVGDLIVSRKDLAAMMEGKDAAEAALERMKAAEPAKVRALQHVLGLLDTAKAAAVFTKPQAGRVIVNVAKLEAALEDLRAALSTQETDHG